MVITNNSVFVFPTFLLVLELAGTTYYFAERGPVTIEVEGVATLFKAGFAIGPITSKADLLGAGVVSNDVSVQVDLPQEVDLFTLLSHPEAIYGGSASLYAYAGGTFSDAVRHAYGPLREAVYADPAEPRLLGFNISRSLLDRGFTHPRAARMNSDSFSSGGFDADPDDEGAYYPIPIGHPGVWAASPIGYTRAYKALRARILPAAASADQRIVVALGRVGATSALVWSDTVYRGTADLLTETDNNGVLVTYLDMTTFSGTVSDITGAGPTYVALQGEGIVDADGGRFTGLGDVIVWALGKSSLANSGDIDWSRVIANKAALNAIGRVDTVLTDRVSPLDWLVSDVLSYFPVFMHDAGDGLYVDVWRYAFGNTDAELTIDTTLPGYERAGAVNYEDADPASVITVNGLLAVNGKYLLSTTLTGSISDIEDGATGHPLCVRSYQDFGENELSLDVASVQDPATLNKLADFYAYKYALPRASVAYYIPWRKVAPRIGMAVLIRDLTAGMNVARGVVSGYSYSTGRLMVSLSLLPR